MTNIPSEPAQLLRCAIGVALLGLCILGSTRLCAFEIETRWSRTAHSGPELLLGDPTTVTWGFVDDGTMIVGSEGASPSSLIAMLDGIYPHGGTGSDLTNREWFTYFEQAFDRWSQLSGLTYLYEPNDTGEPIDETTGPQGEAGLLADVRIGGHYIDGTGGPNTLAYSYYPNHADIVVDTANSSWFGDLRHNSRPFRNLIMHEAGHGQGIGHVDMPQLALMDDRIPTQIDGPQLDDILAVQRLYGDALEKSGGNDSLEVATSLGTLTAAAPLAIGTLGDALAVDIGETDFVSIDGTTDLDYYRFTITAPAVVSLELVPRGATYPIGATELNAKTLGDLSLSLFDRDGITEIDSSDLGGVGQSELLRSIVLPAAGTYFARVAGGIDQVQLYGLEITAEAILLPGDVNLDGVVATGSGDPATDDIAAFVAGWRKLLPTDDPLAAWQKGDLDLNGQSDLRDAFLLRRALAQAGLQFTFNQLHPVPAPATGGLGLVGLAALGTMARRRLVASE